MAAVVFPGSGALLCHLGVQERQQRLDHRVVRLRVTGRWGATACHQLKMEEVIALRGPSPCRKALLP